MRILLSGSSQIKHISALFSDFGWECLVFSDNHSKFKRIISNLHKTLGANLIYVVSGYDIRRSPYWRLAILMGKKIVIHWIGTDVLNIRNAQRSTIEQINKRYVNLSGSEQLRKELEEVGIISKVIPIVPHDIKFSPIPMPKKHAVISYIPKGREDFYGLSLLKRIAKCFADITFFVVSNDGANDKSPVNNIVYKGVMTSDQLKEVYVDCSILFRFPEHDGLSMMVLEALGLGRTVIYKYDFPYTITPSNTSYDSVIETFNEVLSTSPKINQKAIEYVNMEFSINKQIDRYRAAGILEN